jgi:hypothetical protein
VTIPVTVKGIEIVKADGDTSGDSGHFHVFIDREPLEVGEVIPKEAGIVHTTDQPIKVYGLTKGEHTLTVVVGDGAHKRFGEDLEDSVTVNVEGPTLDASTAASVPDAEDIAVVVKSEGVEIVAANGDASGKSGHYHVLIDPASPPKAGETIPAPQPGKIIHSTEESIVVPPLPLGEHTLWVVLGDGNHKAFDPPVMDKLTLTVVER